MKISASTHFEKDLQSLLKKNPHYASKVKQTLKDLLTNPQTPSLRLHKLSGLKNYSLSVDLRIRIIFHMENDTYYLLEIGTHEDVY